MTMAKTSKPQCCPIHTALKYVGKKWTLEIVRDIFMGKRRFSEFLENNPELSTKMLSARLKEMEGNGILEKRVVSTTPLVAEYHLTERGKALRGILYEMSVFAGTQCSAEVCGKSISKKKFLEMVDQFFGEAS